MSGSNFARRAGTAAGLAALFGLGSSDALAGGKHHAKQVVPIYLQQAPASTTVYSAPAATQVYSAPVATQVYSAPVATQVYSAPVATQVYSAPAATQVYSAPAATQVYSAPTTSYYSAPATGANAPVGNAPVQGAQISATSRSDIISELHKEAKDAGTEGTMRERRKALRDSARTKYAEEIGVDESELSAADSQDIDNVVNSILQPQNGSGQGSQATSAPGVVYTTSFAPAYQSMRPLMIVQPVTPVQLYVPVQPKHHWHHK